ncbi:alpha/beta hydrolase [Paenibacillus donghaensis]|uniref:alpha/beta hydrolase n=1 Tax=Paenibacillus donghaensis TaxID=414771 RepID=UPI0018845C31|nr:alpha/beta hydrolase-fold protein [Paenibacillus donghaensis]MBE9918264.1 alpha/beta hydrolase [Paenibacillus donghaensis]
MNNRSSILTIEKFYSAYLDNERDLFVYLPPGYHQNLGKRYPVLYMHDGQNIFHPAFNGYSWHVHQTVDRLIQSGDIEEIIVVGISNMGAERSNEFTHDLEGVCYQDDKVDIRPLGETYEKFVIEEVKIYIDAVFRTKPEAEHTALMGSSRGGQVTYHMGLRRPDVFSKLGIISPYFYCVDPVTLKEYPQYHTFTGLKPVSRIWIDLGSSEGILVMEKHVREVAEKLADAGYEPDHELLYLNEPGAGHVEKDWAARLASPLIHFFGGKGKECFLSLDGSGEVGIKGPACRLNPVLESDHGLRRTLLRASYEVQDEAVLEVREDGIVVPKKEGKTLVTVQYEGLRASKTIRVVPEIPERVTLDIIVHVPAETPGDISIYAYFPLKHDPAQGTYFNRQKLPLHTEFIFQVTRADGRVGADRNGVTIEHRYKAAADGTVEIHVEQWR